VAEKPDLLSKSLIDEFVDTAKVPKELIQQIEDASYGKKKALFRRTSGNVRITIFNGGHEMIPDALIAWLQEKESL
jgi:hypothetical protein